jgi:hypothetical protein
MHYTLNYIIHDANAVMAGAGVLAGRLRRHRW